MLTGEGYIPNMASTSCCAAHPLLPTTLSRQGNYGGHSEKTKRHTLDLSLDRLLRGHGLITRRAGAVAAALAALSLGVVGRGGLSLLGLALEQGVVALDLAESKDKESADDEDPVQVVRDDGAVGGRVGPAEDGVEETPSAAAVDLRAAALLFGGGAVLARDAFFWATNENGGGSAICDAFCNLR